MGRTAALPAKFAGKIILQLGVAQKEKGKTFVLPFVLVFLF